MLLIKDRSEFTTIQLSMNYPTSLKYYPFIVNQTIFFIASTRAQAVLMLI